MQKPKREAGGTLPQALSKKLHDLGEEPVRSVADKLALRLLDKYRRHAEAGASDRWLKAQTFVSLAQIARWREIRGIDRMAYEREHGPARPRMGALDAFKDAEDFGIQLAESSVVGGQWRPPSFLLRQHLDYDKLAHYLRFLHVELGTSSAELGAAFGLTADDIDMAIELHNRRLKEVGSLCPTCGTVTEGKYCMERCRRTR